jgi:hypothetical protein
VPSVGTWGPGVFDDDVAADVLDTWEEAITAGVAEATRAVYGEFDDAMEDEEDAQIVFFALASLQLDAGVLDDAVREKALAAIAPNLERWKDEASGEDAEKRQFVLDELRQRILHFADPS